MSGWLGAINYGVIVANDVDALLLNSGTAPAATVRDGVMSSGRNPRRHPPSPAVSAGRRDRRAASEQRIVCRKTFRRRRVVSLPATIPAIRSCRACSCARRPCRRARSCCRVSRRPGSRTVPVATRMNDVRFKRMVRPGETIEMEVRTDERHVATPVLRRPRSRATGKVAVRFEFACTAAPTTTGEESERLTHGRPLRMDFLQLAGKSILVFGVANRKSVAYHIARRARRRGRQRGLRRALDRATSNRVRKLRRARRRRLRLRRRARGGDRTAARGSCRPRLRRSTAWCTRSPSPTTPTGMKPFHETPKAAFLQAVDISCFSLIALANALKDLLDADASVVTISISTTRMASENYGFMAPIKAALDSSLAFLAKSFSRVLASPLQRRRPGTAEDLGLGRHPRLRRLLSLRRAGDPAQAGRCRPTRPPTWPPSCSARAPAASTPRPIVVDAGMSINYFDADVVRKVMREDHDDDKKRSPQRHEGHEGRRQRKKDEQSEI